MIRWGACNSRCTSLILCRTHPSIHLLLPGCKYLFHAPSGGVSMRSQRPFCALGSATMLGLQYLPFIGLPVGILLLPAPRQHGNILLGKTLGTVASSLEMGQ